ncbi:uncharacterized protein LOC121854349 [Homarus americanus]|uniref:uncharacterized protein LOC121854349 n=1 Tax=Homarus americanus TaxID=6706 RepID=UPI001C497AD2|nr:uncharacterized protein LOC121854349 [Homarus americanus]
MKSFLVLVCLIGAGHGFTQCPNKTELDICLQRIVPLMPKRGLPFDMKELVTMCKAFKKGMQCVDGYTAQCLSEVERAGLEEHLKGARSTLAFLCDDPVFQKEYLSHGVCIKDMQEDWDRCHLHFKYLINQEHIRLNLSDAKRDHNICCIRAGFLSCVYGLSYLKCGKTQAVFLKKVTATLSYSDVQQEKCSKVKLRHCSSAPPDLRSSCCLLLLLLLLLLTLREGGAVA